MITSTNDGVVSFSNSAFWGPSNQIAEVLCFNQLCVQDVYCVKNVGKCMHISTTSQVGLVNIPDAECMLYIIMLSVMYVNTTLQPTI